MIAERTMSVTDFKARCLEVLDQLAARKLDRVTITRHGRTVAVVVPPEIHAELPPLHGCMRGTVVIPEGLDLTAPVLDEPLDADDGILHR